MILDHIRTLDQIEIEAMKIYEFLLINCGESAQECAERGDQLNVYMASTTKLIADAKYWQDIAIKENTLLVYATYKSMPPSTQNKLIDSMCQRENYIATWVERLNRTCTHQQQFMITLISKAKEEMKLSGYGGNVRH